MALFGLVEFVVNCLLEFLKTFSCQLRIDVFGIKSLCEEVIVVFILKDVITLVCNGFLITQLLPSWATCCSKLVPMGSDRAPLFLPAQNTSSLTYKYKVWLPWIAFVYSQASSLTLTTCHSCGNIRPFISNLRNDADMLMECDLLGSVLHPVTNRIHPCQDQPS